MKKSHNVLTSITRWQITGSIIGLAVVVLARSGDADDRLAWQVCLEQGKSLAKRREWEAAAAEFTEAIRLEPKQSAPWVERGNARGELGRFADARADFADAIKVDPENPEPRYRLALACIAEGDDDGYRRACADLLARFGASEDPKVASPLAYTCAARPHAVDAPASLVRWGERAVALFRGNERVLGAALYRAGRYEDAVRRLEEAVRLTNPVAWDWLFLAMSHHRLGHADEARNYLTKAQRWIVAAEANRNKKSAAGLSRTAWHSWNERAEVGALRLEAEALLGVVEDKRPSSAERKFDTSSNHGRMTRRPLDTCYPVGKRVSEDR